MKTVFELQQIYLQACKKQDELFEIDLKYFIKNIEEQIEDNAENGIDTTKFWIGYGERDIGEGYIKYTRFRDVTLRLEEYFINAGFKVYTFDGSILEIRLPLCEM